MGLGIARAGHHKETWPLSTTKILRVWALPGYVAMGTAEIRRDTAGLGTAGILCAQQLLVTARMFCGRALQGYLVVGHCRDTLQLGTAANFFWLDAARILCGWALQEHLVVGRYRDTLCGWALQGHLVVGHCRDAW